MATVAITSTSLSRPHSRLWPDHRSDISALFPHSVGPTDQPSTMWEGTTQGMKYQDVGRDPWGPSWTILLSGEEYHKK